MKKPTILPLFALFFNVMFSQNYYYKSYSWEKDPKVFVPAEDQKKNNDLVVVFEKSFKEVAYDSDGQAVIYETIHYKFHVNSSKAVDAVNKGYMSMSNIYEEIDLRARCITADNKVINLNKSTVKSIDDLEGEGPYKIFAIDGVDVGSDVEVLYTNKKQYYTYAYHHIPSKNPILHYEARIISPSNLVYEVKSYNNLSPFKTDTTDKEKNHYYLIQKDIQPVSEEKYSAGKSNSMGYLAQLTYNTAKKMSKFYTWDIISREYYESYYNLEKSNLKAINKSVEKNKFANAGSTEDVIRALESYIKANFEVSDSYKSLTMEKAIDSKKFSEAHCLAYYVNAFKFLNIPFELVLTTDRRSFKFDPKFPSYLYAKEQLIYFPGINKYLSPFSIYSRVGFPDPDCMNNEGLFIKEVSIGDLNSSSAKTKRIGATDVKDSYHNTNVAATLDFSNNKVSLNVTQNLFGYSAYYYQPIYRYLSKEQKDDLNKIFYLTENSQGVKNLEVLNIEEADVLKKPLIAKYTFDDDNDFLENAGNKFIFKVGLLIGPQAELYQEKERKSPVDVGFTHYMKREIEVIIPEGYKATNLNDLVINKACIMDGAEMASFKSSFEQKNNKIVVTVYEDYKQIEFGLGDFNPFKDVINAAADFNKKNIIFEKL